MQIFRPFTARAKINQTPCVIFQAISFSIIFASPFCIMTDNFSEIFHLRHYMLCTKRTYQRTYQFFWILKALMKVHQIPHAIFAQGHKARVYSWNCSVSWNRTPLNFLAQKKNDKKSPYKWNFQTFKWLGENSSNSSCHIFSSSLFSVMRGNSSVHF